MSAPMRITTAKLSPRSPSPTFLPNLLPDQARNPRLLAGDWEGLPLWHLPRDLEHELGPDCLLEPVAAMASKKPRAGRAR